MDIEMAIPAAADAVAKGDAQDVLTALFVTFVFVASVLSAVTFVAMLLRQRSIQYVSGQMLVIVLFLAAPWPARYDSDGGLLWVATSLGLVITAGMILKRRRKSYSVRKFADELAVFNEKNVRPHWLPESPSH